MPRCSTFSHLSLVVIIWCTANPWSKSGLPTLGLKEFDAKCLLASKNIGIQVYPLVPHSDFPNSKNLPELARFMSSLLTALDFAHRRNVMNCDIHRKNLTYHKGTTYMFDWNAAQSFAPNQVKLHQEDENKRILPPETVNKDSLHVTVSAADVWATGIVLNKLLCKFKVCTMPKRHRGNTKLRKAHALAAWMMTEDPHARPSAAELLKHDFFKL
jgi:serine/threonine protein kinase